MYPRVSEILGEMAAIAEKLTGLHGQGAAWTAWRLLERLESDGATDLNAALTSWAHQLRGAGMTVVISDLFSPSGYQQGIDALLGQRQDVLLIHVLAPDELQPPGELGVARRDQHLTVQEDHHRQARQVADAVNDQLPRRGVVVDVNPLVRNAIARQKVSQLIRSRRPACP